MELGDIWAKVANNARLTPAELDYLIRAGRETQQRNAQLSGSTNASGTQDGDFFKLRSMLGEFQVSPIDGFFASLSTPVSIAHNTITNITFDQSSFPSPYFSRPDSDSKIFCANARRTIAVFGSLQWGSSGVGRRGIHMDLFNAADTKLTGITLHSMLPTGLAVDTLPFSDVFWLPVFNEGTAYGTLHHVRLTVVQTSGGALDLNAVRAGFFCLR